MRRRLGQQPSENAREKKPPPAGTENAPHGRRSSAPRFVVVVGMMSFFADFSYEGSRSMVGQYLGLLGAGALVNSVVSGFGTLLGYGLRLVSGSSADRTGKYWRIAIVGYVLQMTLALLAVPAAIELGFLAVARMSYPNPSNQSGVAATLTTTDRMPKVFWRHLGAAALVGAGFADFALIEYRFERSRIVGSELVHVFYAVSMAGGGAGLLVFGRLFDRFETRLLVPLTRVLAAYAPLAFLGGFWAWLAGVILWGVGTGVQESVIRAALARMVKRDRRVSAFKIFTGGYGVAWFAGSTAIGVLFGVSLPLVVVFAPLSEVAAVPLFVVDARRAGRSAEAA